MRIVLDTTILVRAHESSQGPARQVLLDIVGDDRRADVICTRDEDFYDPVIAGFLTRLGSRL